MKNLNIISNELFNKIRGRFSNVTIGDNEGNVVTEPEQARFFDFNFKNSDSDLGKVSVSLSEDEGIVILYSSNIVANKSAISQQAWYDFLREIRFFAKKRLLNFDTRDITKSNLNKRDYKFLAKNKPEDNNMTESTMYGTSKVSYQNVDGARLVVNHSTAVNAERAASRTQNINAIYIESADGERFKYPYKHLNGARAMARHVAEGGKPYDEFGSHITSLSEEMNKLRKFKNYMGRSSVMAESLAGYVDVVKERIDTVKKTIQGLQRSNYYKEAIGNFETAVMEDVPSDVAENWIDQLTIRQFNEELKDVFPYIYKLVSEATRAKTINPEDLLGESAQGDFQIRIRKAQAGDCDSILSDLSAAHKDKKINDNEYTMLKSLADRKKGQLAEGSSSCPKCSCDPKHPDPDCECTHDNHVDEACKSKKKTEDEEIEEAFDKIMGQFSESPDVEFEHNGYKYHRDEDITDDERIIYHRVVAPDGKESVLDFSSHTEMDQETFNNFVDAGLPTRRDIGSIGTLRPEDVAKLAKKNQANTDEDNEDVVADKQPVPLGEFILSYYDKETGEFPKGETGVLTMIEKQYGENYITHAKAFIERINQTFEEHQMQTQPQQMEAPVDNTAFEAMKRLAGI